MVVRFWGHAKLSPPALGGSTWQPRWPIAVPLQVGRPRETLERGLQGRSPSFKQREILSNPRGSLISPAL